MIANWLPEGLRRKVILLMPVRRHNSSFSQLPKEKKDNICTFGLWTGVQNDRTNSSQSLEQEEPSWFVSMKRTRGQLGISVKVTFLDTFPVQWNKLEFLWAVLSHHLHWTFKKKSVDCRILPISWLEGWRRCYQVWNLDSFLRNTCWSFKVQQLLAVQTT